jgi:hypothetical protein
MISLLVSLALGVVAPQAASAKAPVQAQAQWTEFVPATGLFSIQLPGRPKEQVGTMKTAAGDAKSTQYQFETSSAFFVIGVTEFPPGSTSKQLPQTVLDGARDGALANIRGKASEDIQVFLAGPASRKGAFPGRQIVADVPPDLILRARIFLVDDTLLQLMVVQKKAVASPQAFSRMADSIKLLR